MYESPRLKVPTRRGMSLLAIAILEDFARAAHQAPIPMTDPARMALGWLMQEGIALDFQAGRFAESATTHREANGTVDGYMRRTEMDQMLEAWRRVVRDRDRKATGRG